jgi:predicted DsbA family dithiol-disulfide isomerase
VVIVEYSDFQCPFCTRHWREVAPRLEEAYIKNGQVRFVYKHFTVKGPDSVSAALAAECAAVFGQDKFWAYHDLLFSRSGQMAFNADNLKAFAAELQLDPVAFNECFDTQKYLQVVQANNAEAQQLGVGGTPGFFINGTPVAGAQPFEVFQQAIEAELAGVKSQGDTTAPPAGPTSVPEDVAPPPTNNASAAAPPTPVEEAWDVEISQLRGLGFSADGRQLLVAANDGFRIFADGAWSTPDLPRHDYLGYSVTDDGFYSSGYPDPAANLASPFGLVKSTDRGETLTSLAFEGESDFNIIDVGYQNHAIYVFTSIPNSRLTLGIHYSLDDGQTWQESALRGIRSRMAQLAVHPAEANRVALATEGGLFLSSDYGDTFELVDESGPAIAAEFDPGGALLFFGYSDLSAYDPANKTVLDLPTPALSPEDAIARIAISPAKIDEVAFATFLGDLYLSRDGGQTWQQILRAGKGKSGQ